MSTASAVARGPKKTWLDYAFAACVFAACVIAFARYRAFMDYYEQGILISTAAATLWFGWFWKPMRVFLPLCALLALAAITLYDGQLANASGFWLKYLLASQSAVMWMCVLFFLATVLYWIGLLRRADTLLAMASWLTWAAAAAALTSKLVRWYESYLIGADVGHIPVSNLYEVFILFCLITALMYLYYEARYATRSIGAFVLLVISAAVAFIIWYSLERQAHEIQPLIPALQSWWMKIHVPANFVGYGAFAIAAMLGVAWLLAVPATISPLQRRILLGLALAMALICSLFLAYGQLIWPALGAGQGFIAKFGYCMALLLVVAAYRGGLAAYLPAPAILDEISYKAIAIGFLFFTIATILGAMWAAEAWGGYWSWDPKETWALIVWLNYATWLHMRLVKGWRGESLAWWSVAGLFVTTFAFIGVNMFLSGLHSYGGL